MKDPTDSAATNTMESEKLIFRKSDNILSSMISDVPFSTSEVAETNVTRNRRCTGLTGKKPLCRLRVYI